MFCKNCGKELSADTLVCPDCGAPQKELKYCIHCGKPIEKDCIICPHCGKQVEEIKAQQAQPVVIQNTNTNVNQVSAVFGRKKNKWVAFFLCLFLGMIGAHKFYEGKVGTGILYLLTFGVFCFGWIIDIFVYLFKPNPYYV